MYILGYLPKSKALHLHTFAFDTNDSAIISCLKSLLNPIVIPSVHEFLASYIKPGPLIVSNNLSASAKKPNAAGSDYWYPMIQPGNAMAGLTESNDSFTQCSGIKTLTANTFPSV
jgi:hypothetical protein